MTRIRLLGTRGGRCAYCKDSLDVSSVRCTGCGTQTHEDCLQELGRCPTFGCEARPAGVAGGRDGDSADRSERRQRRGRHRERHYGMGERVMRRLAERQDRPSLRGPRSGIRNRLVGSALWHTLLLLALLALLALCITHPGATWEFFKHGKNGRINSDFAAFAFMLIAAALGTGFGAYCTLWLRRVPWVKSEVDRLLDDTHPVPMKLRVITRGSGKHKTTYAELNGDGRSLSFTIGGILTPGWLSSGLVQDVLVYGSDDPSTPCLVEMLDGSIALLDDGKWT